MVYVFPVSAPDDATDDPRFLLECGDFLGLGIFQSLLRLPSPFSVFKKWRILCVIQTI